MCIRNLILVCFHRFCSDIITTLNYGFIVFSKKITVFWCIFIAHTLINCVIQGIGSITESSFFIIFCIEWIDTSKYRFKGCFSVSIKFSVKTDNRRWFHFWENTISKLYNAVSAPVAATRDALAERLQSILETTSSLYNRMM